MNFKTISTTIDELKNKWSTPQTAYHHKEKCPFLLSCIFTGGIDEKELPKPHQNFPCELLALWRLSEKTELFKDNLYEQWGLELLTPKEAISETSRQQQIRGNEILTTDIVLGRFYGDSELLIITKDGGVLVCTPLDHRHEWTKAAESLSEFLEKMADAEGAKFWESSAT
ncbi:hypothetical protein HU761_26615 [Pseudomonas sp. SWRI59]|uniref:hypothetical protein n=1 Tax=Pseudomonas TaxID=286 RepID=UPI001646DE2B|nr:MULTISPECIES: hypothetical protein [unclassified Pseudomonas]MBC3483989.1 hypothetical protein [Pseudomonas sp. SWRI77]MBC3504950.1 hypothetical protein [Pseudomonas sp. SWRI59]MBC3508423.1 hypothetical protein [Pseudomonas sp. SWRI68]UVL06259.1 hypothetical protein LOY26_12235 [Pseudomonas sp. B21-047]